LTVNKFEEIKRQELPKQLYGIFSETMLFLNYYIFSGSAEALVRCSGLAYFLRNMCAKHYENPIMLSRVTAKNVGNVFLRHSVINEYNYNYTLKAHSFD